MRTPIVTLADLAEHLPTRVAARILQRKTRNTSQRWTKWPPHTPVELWRDCTTAVDLLVIPGFGRGSLSTVNDALFKMAYGPLRPREPWLRE